MEDKSSLVAQNIDALKLPPAIQQRLREFVRHLIDLYASDLASIIAFGSAVTGDYDEQESDVNLLVVYSGLELIELERVAELSRRWLRKQKFAPRFLSKRNLDESVALFQIDFLSMRDAHLVLWGEDLLAGIEMRRAELRWQISYEIKSMRMRIKQQFWRAAGDTRLMRTVLIKRFTSLTHLMRALLLLYDADAPIKRHDTIDAAAQRFHINRAFAESVLQLRHNQSPPERAALIEMFTGLMEMIRTIDSCVEEVKL